MTAPRTSPLAAFGVVGAWLLLKVHNVFAWVVLPNQYGDTDYYAWAVRNALRDGSVARWLTEYPTPAAWFLLLPELFGPPTNAGYRLAFLVLISLVDLAFLGLLLWRVGTTTAAAWVLLVTLAGQLALLRLDLLPAVLAGAGLLLALRGRTPWAATLIALGTAAKLWPILLFPLALGRKGSRGVTTAVFAASGLVLAGVSVLAAGWPRLFSPLDYQADRGLQIEAVAATIPMLNAVTRPGYDVHYSTFKAFEVRGPDVASWLQVATAASVVAVVVVAGLLVWWWVRGCPREATGYLGLLMVCLFVATSKAYSPQYSLWIAALAVVVFGLSRLDRSEHEPLRAAIVLGATTVLMLLTTMIYPTYYGDVIGHTPAGARLLVLRNGLLLCLVAFLVALVIDRLRRAGAASR